MKQKIITVLMITVAFLFSPVTAHASSAADIQGDRFAEETTEEAQISIDDSVFTQYINSNKKNKTIQETPAYVIPETNTKESIRFICDEIQNKSILKNILNDRNAVAELAVTATNISMIHNTYAPAQEKAELLNHNLSEIDEYISSYAKLIQHQAYQTIFQLDSQNDNSTIALKQLEDIKNKINRIRLRSEQIDLSVDYFYGYYELPQIRKDLVNTALLLEGQITYEWGSKPTNAGWNKRWDIKGTGLDCSGFIEWVYWTTFGNSNESLRSTLVITDTQQQITYEELLPGDLGTILTEGSYYIDYAGNKHYSEDAAKQANISAGYSADDVVTYSNHVGIYVGKDEKGNDIWCHCQGGDVKTVTVGPFEKFVNYYRMPDTEN